MYTLRTISLKLFRAGLSHVLMTIVTVAIAVSLIVAMLSYTSSAQLKLEADTYEQYGDSHIEFGYEMEDASLLTTAQLQQVRNLDGVTAVAPVALNFTAQVEQFSPPVIGVGNDALTKSRYHFAADMAADEVIVSEMLLQTTGKSLGDTLTVAGKSMRIIETIHVPTSIVLAPRDMVLSTLQAPSDAEGKFALVATADQATYATTVGTAIGQLDKALRVDLQNDSEFVQRNVTSLRLFSGVLTAFILLIVGTLLLANFQLLFTKLNQQLTVLRAIGGTQRQVGKIVFVQVTTIIAMGVFIGTVAGVVMMQQGVPLLSQSLDLPPVATTIPWRAVLVAALVCFSVLQLFAMWQVRKSSRVLPFQLQQANTVKPLKWSARKSIVLSALVVLAALLLVVGLRENKPLVSVVGTGLCTGVLLYLLPYGFTWGMRKLLPTVRHKESYLALQQLIPQVRRNTPIILTLVGLMVILSFSTTTMKTATENGKAFLQSQYPTELIATYDLADKQGDDVAAMLAAINEVDGVRESYAESVITDHLVGEVYTGMQATTQVQEGIVITDAYAKKMSLAVGDTLTITDRLEIEPTIWQGERVFQEGVYEDHSLTLPITAITAEQTPHVAIYYSWATSDAFTKLPLAKLYVDAPATQLATIEQNLDLPALHFSSKTERMAQEDMLGKQRYVLVIGTLVVLIVATLLGVLQTLWHAMYAKRGDYKIQRLLGLTPKGLQQFIVLQALAFIIYGVGAGLLLGALFTKLLWFAIEPTGGLLINFVALLGVAVLFIGVTAVFFSWQGHILRRLPIAQL